MECKYCRTENIEGAVFCSQCGTRIDGKKVCKSCGKLNAETNVYCNYCGGARRFRQKRRRFAAGSRLRRGRYAAICSR
ncbi:MAG: hypothetical protein DBX59_04580 [Bacillota bacterium]|nr:MAG: hypothetical protein DBX59_04580 [Bacillota bacterium]